jgi:Hemerythrin HHE cation binding domain
MGTAQTAAWDLYREIHKGMRSALTGLAQRAGSADPADGTALAELRDEWRDVLFVLRGHHDHEDRFCDALIEAHAPALRAKLEAQHALADSALAQLDAAAASLGPDTLHAFYLALCDFIAVYFEHLRFEECEVMPALNRALPDSALAEVTQQIRGSVPPADMCVFIKYMVRGMNLPERTDMLGGMYQFAPAEIFELFRAAAERALPPAEYRAVAVRAGFG